MTTKFLDKKPNHNYNNYAIQNYRKPFGFFEFELIEEDYVPNSLALKHKTAGSWSDVKRLYVKDSGAWKECKYAYIKESGSWKQFFTSVGPNTGYFGGGALFTPAVPSPIVYYSTMDKITYSSDTTSAVSTAALRIARDRLAAVGNQTTGYFGGGRNGSTVYTNIDKLTFSTDTTAPTPGAALLVSRNFAAATGNQQAGYFGGGLATSSATTVTNTMQKINYVDDTVQNFSTQNLSFARSGLSATGNQQAGYFGGGTNPSLGSYSIIDKLDYSSETTAPLPSSGRLSFARDRLAATGNSTSGYFGGGFPGPFSTIDKINYSTDTRVSTSATLIVARRSLAATGNSTAGYFGGGGPSPSFSSYTTIDKLTYSTETVSTVPGSGCLSAARYDLSAASARANGLPQ